MSGDYSRNWDLIANAIALGGFALGLAAFILAFLIWYFGLGELAVRYVRRVRARRRKPAFERSASWWVEQHPKTRAPRHRARLAWLDPAGRVRAAREDLGGRRRQLRTWHGRVVAKRPLFHATWIAAAEGGA